MSNIVGKIVQGFPFGPPRRLHRAAADPIRTQQRLLRQLVRRARATVYGARLGLSAIASDPNLPDAVGRYVPLQTYEDIHELVERARGGEPDVMWPGKIFDFAVSSGTASAGKIIPLSRETLRNNSRFSLAAALNHFNHTGDTSMWRGKMLSLPGRIEEDPRYPGTLIGEVSGFQSRYAPRFVRQLYQAVPHDILFMDNWDRKLDAVVEHTLDQDIRVMVMVPSWALVLFDKLLAAHNRRRGVSKARRVLDVWPNLRVFFSGGVSLSSYRELLTQQIGASIRFVESYGASEGYFAIQDRPDDSDMLLHLDNGVFYEFVPMDQVGTGSPERLWLRDVQLDTRYALYVSSCSGLWSYSVGDVVRFTSHEPHKIVVAGRTSEMIDKYGEAVFGEEARAALHAACTTTGARVVEYHVAPTRVESGSLPAHEWLIEFERLPSDPDAFGRAIDEYLQQVNRHYQIRREAGAFMGPRVVGVPRGTFTMWLEHARDRVSVQSKVPRMSEERHIADGVLTFAANTEGES
ncbi:MAG: GH3 auxin-responsive promoter family protein [Rhodothermales bacterium]|nr:GH3 auxin-responsive promoter family protein [Rhodothermales bacterium]